MIVGRQMLRVRCAQEQKPSPQQRVSANIAMLRKKLEDARSPDVRETWNKVSGIAANDARFANDVLKELDVFHKGMVEIIREVVVANAPGQPKQGTTAIVRVEKEDDNIFKGP